MDSPRCAVGFFVRRFRSISVWFHETAHAINVELIDQPHVLDSFMDNTRDNEYTRRGRMGI